MIKNMLKWREESDTYLTHVCRHCWSRQITMKVDVLGAFSQYCGFQNLCKFQFNVVRKYWSIGLICVRYVLLSTSFVLSYFLPANLFSIELFSNFFHHITDLFLSVQFAVPYYPQILSIVAFFYVSIV